MMRFENFNLTCWIIHVRWLLLLLWPTAYNYASAQTVTQPPANPDGIYTTLDPSMAIIILVLISTFFIIAVFSIYVRHCSDSRAESVLPSRSFSGHSRSHGLDPSVIESFPVFVYSAVKDLKIGKGALECAVCLSEFEDDETLRLLKKCDHVFHPDCIDAWLASQVTCPVCRARLTPESNETVKLSDANNESVQTQNNSAPELNEEQHGVVIDFNDEQSNSDAQALEITNVSHVTPMRNRPPRLGIPDKLPRSHSTGHSLVPAGVNIERYTLRFPEEVRKQLMMSGKFKRTVSFNAVLAREGSSRKGGLYRSGAGEGSSRGRYFVDRQLGGRSERWVFSMTPPFVSKMGSVKGSGEVQGDGSSSNGRNLLTAVKSPLNCLNVKIGQGGESSSARPQPPCMKLVAQ